MHKLKTILPSTTALFAFEAAARHKSFTKAAQELNVSQPAISHQVRQIEDALGVSLFVRAHRSIELTASGDRFFRDVSIGLEHIFNSAEALKTKPIAGKVTMSVSTLFATHWLLPRLADFKARYPDIDIRFQTTDRDDDLARDGIDLSIRLGHGRWPHLESCFFAAEEVFPVCSPAYLEAVGPIESSSDLLNTTLLHLDEPFRPRINWNEWLQTIGGIEDAKADHGYKFTDALIVVQAAIEGQGIALGWGHILENILARGDLVRPLPDLSYQPDNAFYIVWAKNLDMTDEAVILKEWLLDCMDNQKSQVYRGLRF